MSRLLLLENKTKDSRARLEVYWFTASAKKRMFWINVALVTGRLTDQAPARPAYEASEP